MQEMFEDEQHYYLVLELVSGGEVRATLCSLMHYVPVANYNVYKLIKTTDRGQGVPAS